MKTIINKHNLEHAQMLPIVVIGLIVMIAMAALILDGGALMLNRRAAQNAADAGALAGARVLCKEAGIKTAEINAAILKYTTTENGAIIVNSKVTAENVGVIKGLVKGEVVVTAKIEQNSFFAKIFDQNTLTSGATAAAGCFSYRPEIVLPIAWSCHPPIAGSVSEDCDYVRLSWSSFKAVAEPYLGVPLPKIVNPTPGQAKAISDTLFAAHSSDIYIVMDSDAVCGDGSGTTIKCDFNVTDRIQLGSKGNRGWLNLDGGSGGTSTVRGWIENGLKVGINSHTWLSGISGVATDIYSSLETRIDEVVWVPIFNVLCPDLPTDINGCFTAAHNGIDPPGFPLLPGQNDVVITGNPATPVYHIVGFTPFVITCVRRNPSDTCPGFTLAQNFSPSLDNRTRSLEGYFVEPDTLDGENVSSSGADLGIYTVSLTR